ncbi:hypothetical protein E1200_22485 [Actinomadura sp. GC306]|uniref:hypothetical protein n=1 Tax=Actinomadura sp. GC306 TaxID=2530367 RepID=UPI001042AD32|nr:hypothetical protein [Actinomadura sp. GC306]TDC63376.1 hypothetical protein E1200_22485 [Actinomadura sp. GC306]
MFEEKAGSDMRALIRKAATTAAVAAITIALIALTAVPAFAVGPYSAGNTSPAYFLDTNTGVSSVCPVSTVSGMTDNGPSGPIPDTFSNVTFSGCITTGGISTTVTATGLPWNFNVVSYNPGTGVVSGTLTGVTLTITINSSPTCTMTVGGPGSGPGTVNAAFGYSTGLIDLGVGGNLEVQTATPGCTGLANLGDPYVFAAQYQINTWTVTPGGSITAINIQPLQTLNPNTGVAVVCPISSANGTLQSGGGLQGAQIGQLSSVSTSGCAAIGVASTSVTATGLPWHLNAVSYDGLTGVTTGTLTGVEATVTINVSPPCTVTVGGPGGGPGTINGTFTNSTDVLAVSGGNLEVQTAVPGFGCIGLANPGDPIVIAGQYQVTPGQTITSP